MDDERDRKERELTRLSSAIDPRNPELEELVLAEAPDASLVYADWLEAHGSILASLVRASHAFPAAEQTELDLLRAHPALTGNPELAWRDVEMKPEETMQVRVTKPGEVDRGFETSHCIAVGSTELTFSRGFVSCIRFLAPTWDRHTRSGVETVRATLAAPAAALATILHIPCGKTGYARSSLAEVLATVAASSQARRLVGINLFARDAPPLEVSDLASVMDVTRLPKLTSLVVNDATTTSSLLAHAKALNMRVIATPSCTLFVR